LLGAAARYEGEHKAERQRRKHRELAEAGKPSGGGDRPFGFEPDRVTIRESEAGLIRDAVAQILAGRSLRSIVMAWASAGVTGPRGAAWSKTPFKRMVTSPRIAGLREHRGAVVGPAVWPGIITPAQREAIVAIVNDRARPRVAPTRYLLTGGLARCGRCGAAMVARPNERKDRRYACAKEYGGCNGTFHLAATLEDHVRDQVLDALSGPALDAMRKEASADDDDGLGAELAAVEARRREAVDAYGRGQMSLASFKAIDRDVEARADRLRNQIASRSRTVFAAALPPASEALADWWELADVETRRHLVSLVVARVDILPAVPGRNRFDADRIRISWRV
jgi:hypothetical protein